MNILEKRLIEQLINGNFIDCKIINNEIIDCNGNLFTIKEKNIFNEIIIDNVITENYTLEEFLVKVNLKQFSSLLLQDLNLAILSKESYLNNYKDIFVRSQINNMEELFSEESDEFNNYFNRIIDREPESSQYVFMYLNTLADIYRVEKSIQVEIPFLDIKELKMKWEGSDKALEVLNNKLPVHPSFIENDKEHYKEFKITKEKCYFTASHRTFTTNNREYYFKIDVPHKISSTIRLLKRSEDRLKASQIATSKLKRYNDNKKFKLYILNDICSGKYENHNVVLRKKYRGLKIIPLFSLTAELPFEEESTLLDWLIKQSKKDPLLYTFEYIIKPILDTFNYFINISIENKGKFIQPYNFHRQNLGLAVENSDIVGVVAQDLDMQKELTPINICMEYDTNITKFFLIPIQKHLEKNFNVDKQKYIKIVSEYVKKTLFIDNCLLNDFQVKNKSFLINILGKHLNYYPNNKEFYEVCKNPYR